MASFLPSQGLSDNRLPIPLCYRLAGRLTCLYEPDEEIVYFDSLDALPEILDRFSAHPNEAVPIAERVIAVFWRIPLPTAWLK